MANQQVQVQLLPLVGKTIAVHTVTYAIMGMLASSILDYESAFSRPHMACWMRQFSDPMIMAGPLFQPIRGLVFALVAYPLHRPLRDPLSRQLRFLGRPEIDVHVRIENQPVVREFQSQRQAMGGLVETEPGGERGV